MKIAVPIALAVLGLCVVGFAVLNPQLDVQFTAAFVEYRGNTLGLGLVLLTLILAGLGSREVIKRIVAKAGKRKSRQL